MVYQFNRSGSAFWTNLNQTWQQCPKMLEKCWVTSATEFGWESVCFGTTEHGL